MLAVFASQSQGIPLDILSRPDEAQGRAVLRAAPDLPAIEHLRAATKDLHERLDSRLDAVAQLADPARRAVLIPRYAAFHLPADAALAPFLMNVAGLDFERRTRAPLLRPLVGGIALPAFPAPSNRAEALGMLYVLDGSTLGGHVILRALAARGITEPDLAFLDPYGAETGARWRGFLTVLAREVTDDTEKADACAGAVRAFRHAERVLCGDA